MQGVEVLRVEGEPLRLEVSTALSGDGLACSEAVRGRISGWFGEVRGQIPFRIRVLKVLTIRPMCEENAKMLALKDVVFHAPASFSSSATAFHRKSRVRKRLKSWLTFNDDKVDLIPASSRFSQSARLPSGRPKGSLTGLEILFDWRPRHKSKRVKRPRVTSGEEIVKIMEPAANPAVDVDGGRGECMCAGVTRDR